MRADNVTAVAEKKDFKKPEEIFPKVLEPTSEEYPLQYRWTLWHNAPKKQAVWAKPKYVCAFSTVGDFWRLFNNLSVPSTLIPGSDLHLFKGSVEPEWEHELNKGGGMWTLNLSGQEGPILDTNWFHVILTMIGNNFDGLDDYICGVVASARPRRFRLQLWIRSQHDSEIRKLGQIFKKCCNSRQIQYTPHGSKDSKRAITL